VKNYLYLWGVVLLGLACATAASAQQVTGSVEGVVADASGATTTST